MGDRAANLRQAIACYEQALRFRTPEADPFDYPMFGVKLGSAHLPTRGFRLFSGVWRPARAVLSEKCSDNMDPIIG